VAAIASIGLGHHSAGLHCGLFYENSNGSIELLHFADQAKLLSAGTFAQYYEVTCHLPDESKLAISDFCRLVFRLHHSQGLRYAVTRTDEFLPDGKLKIDKNGTGFTCATFVKAIFAVVGRPVLNEKSWPPATFEDNSWMRKLIEGMIGRAKNAFDKKHFKKVDLNCAWSRYKPEEVAAAMQLAPPPAEHAAVEPEAKKLAEHVINNFPPLH
jgi:hypothetical protein